jgi:O-antigen/teichoic acid export membrane protein
VGTRGRVSRRGGTEPGAPSIMSHRRDGPVSGVRRQAVHGQRSPRANPQPGNPDKLARDIIQAVLGVLDQGVTALGSLIPVVLLGRIAGANQLGIFSLAVSAALFVAISSQSLFLSGYPIFRARNRGESATYTFHVVLFGLVTQALLIPVCVGVLAWMSDLGSSALPGGLAAVAFVTATALRSYFRTLSLARRDLPEILALDTLALLILSGLLAWLAANGEVSVWNVFLALSFANAVFAAAWCISYSRQMSIRLQETWRYLNRSLTFGGWAFAGAGFGSMPYYVTPWLLALTRGTEETAAYAAASSVVGLANHIFLGLTRGIEARTADALHQGGLPALQESLRRTMWIVLPALSAIVLAILLTADLLAEFMLPGRAAETADVARVLSVALLVGSFRVVAGNGLWAMSLPRATFAADFVRGVVCVGLGIVGAGYAGAVGCAVAVLLGDAISSIMVVARYRAELRSRRS